MASSSSSCSSSIFSTSRWTYDVFLSFCGEDTRDTATDFIYFALYQKGIHTFKDDEKLEKGKTIESELFKAIKESRFAVVILSKNYASSTWCLNELVEIIACEKLGMTILPIFYNVDPSDVRNQKGTFAQPFDKYEKQFEEKVGKWRAALNHVANIAGYHVDNSPLSEVVKSIESLISRNSSCTFSEVTEGLVGIDSQVAELGSCLALGLDDDVRFIGVWAMGGMGKTTLARVVYKMVSEKFEACCIIYNVREKCETAGGLLSLQKYLVSQISKQSNLNIEDIYDGVHLIKKRLSHKRILLVLDDVNKLVELEYLAGKHDWFGRGSRIIITTRDKHLLEGHLKTHLKDKIYEVKALKNEDALHLFCSKAFKNELVPDEYLELSKGFLNYVAGHPLALKVLGSFLSIRSVVEWKSGFEKLKKHPNPDVTRVLKISYDGLEGAEQEIFKDIACFFNHEEKDYVIQILKILGRDADIGLSILIERCLLKISENNELWMHDLLRDMGRDIVRLESPNEPEKRSRLWHYEDIDNVLKNDTGTEKVQAMDIRGAEDTSIYHEEKKACWGPQVDIRGAEDTSIYHEEKKACWRQGWVLSTLSCQGLPLLVTLWGWVQRTLSLQGFTSSKKPEGLLWNPNAFLKMRNLKFLRIRNISLRLDTLPNSLRYFEYNDYPSKSLPPLPAELVELQLLRSKIELLWGGMKNFDKLKSIHMAGSSDMIIAPNFNGVPNLEELNLEGCSKLRMLHPSTGKLEKLKLLNLKECQELTTLPNEFELKSLVTLNLTRCSRVKKIPEFVGDMKHLQELLLEGTAITELPSSVECLIGLNILILRDCKKLVRLPNTICNLTSLKNLDLLGCSKFDKLPEDLGNIVSLKELCLSKTAIRELPSSFEFLIGLTSLDLTDCKNFVLLPSTICSLKSLDKIILSGCSEFDKLPEDLGNIVCLKELDLSGTAIRELPSSVEFLIGLTSLDLNDCKNFVLLPSTICSLKSLDKIILSGCSKFDKLPEYLGNITSLKELDFSGTAIEELPSSVESLIGLTSLILKDCKNFVLLPSTICSLKSLDEIILSRCSKFDKLPKDLGNIVSLKSLFLDGTAIEELPSSVEFLIGLEMLYLDDCKNFVHLPSTVCSLKSLMDMSLSGCPKFVNLPENFGNLKRLRSLYLGGTAIEVLPSSFGRLAALEILNLKDCKNFVRLPSTIYNLKMACSANLAGCSKITDLQENLENMESLSDLRLGGTAIKELPSFIIHRERVPRLSLDSCPSGIYVHARTHSVDLSDCNLSTIPSCVDGFSKAGFFLELFLRGNDFVSLPESFSQFYGVIRLYLDGCKSLRSLSNIPSTVHFICVDNCTSLESLPEPSNDFCWSSFDFTVQCFNCFKLADNIKDFSNVFEGQSSKQFEKCYVIPGREIPKWFEKVNICDTSVVSFSDYDICETTTFKEKKVKIQLPGSGSGCDEWRGIVLCVVFLPSERHHRFCRIRGKGLQEDFYSQVFHTLDFMSEYGKVESHHLWLRSVSKNHLRLPETPGCSIDKKGFHQVELEIVTEGLEVEKIGFRVV